MNRNWLVGVVLGAIVGVAVSAFIQSTYAQNQATPLRHPQSWEYTVKEFNAIHGDFEGQLNSLVEKGWEYVGPLHSYEEDRPSTRGQSYTVVAFRRPRK